MVEQEAIKKVISILQSGYLPYAGFFELMSRCDTFVLYDDVQFDKNSWRNRNRIRVPQGDIWLTVPVVSKGHFGQTLKEVRIAPGNWQKKHLSSIRHYYAKSGCFDEYIGFFERIYAQKWEWLLDLNFEIIEYFRKILGVNSELILSSGLKSAGNKTERIISICRELGADAYISTNGAKDYLDEGLFPENNIALAYQDYPGAKYRQVYPGFVDNLSVIDLVFNCGKESRDIMLSFSSCKFNREGKYRGIGR